MSFVSYFYLQHSIIGLKHKDVYEIILNVPNMCWNAINYLLTV